MNYGPKIRPATPEDASEIIRIYSPYILHSAFTFEFDIPSIGNMQHRIISYMEKYPWLVAEENGKLMGYAYASAYRERRAYQWCVESSVYLDDAAKGSGIALQLYNKLFSILKSQGIRNVYSIITLPNGTSEKFHAKCGFEKFAVYKNVGHKLGKWHDVLWMIKVLNDIDDEVREPVWFSKISSLGID